MLYRRAGKRILDIVVAGSALLFLSPLLALTALAVALTLGRPLVFRQTRPGRHGRLVTVFKFRTMTDERLPEGGLLPDEDRLSPLGRWLRATSLDELPELVNVLKGEMSLVGPRPLLVEYLPIYSHEQARRHQVHPGITGWAQVNGRNGLSWEKRLEFDVWYVDNVNFFLDLRIMWRTIAAVLGRRGITAEGHATMPYFTGRPNGDEPPRPLERP